MPDLDATHDPDRRSWVAAANVPGADFPVQNLPLGVFEAADGEGRVGAAIGDRVLDLRAAAGLLPRDLGESLAAPDLGTLMALGRGASARLRGALSDLLREGGPEAAARTHLRPMAGLAMRLPARVGDFSDFMASRHHTVRLGTRRDPANPLPPAFPHLPIAYHGRAGTVQVSGTPVRRPHGQWRHADGQVRFGPTAALDFELELATWVGGAGPAGTPVPMARAAGRLFGFGLLNDWSVRDVQFFEMAPLGPFLGKSVATSVSPWVITAEAMIPFSAPRPPPAPGEDGPPLHLDSPADRTAGGLSLAMEAWLEPAGGAPLRLCATDAAHLAWTPAQMLVHQASNGCGPRPGDLLGSGTVSGPGEGARACLAEILLSGPVALPDGGARRWLEDGDAVVLRARAAREGFVPIGFGECRGAILPALPWPGD